MSKSNSTRTSNSIFTPANLTIPLLIYISVAGAISLPSYISNQNNRFPMPVWQVTTAKQEVRKNFLDIAKTQEAYYFKNHRFADSISELGIEIQPETNNYHYRIVQPMIPVQDLDASVTPDSKYSMRMAIAQKKLKNNLKNYLGIVYTAPQTDASGKTEIVTRSIICEMIEKNPLPTTMPTLINANMQCPAGSIKLGE